MENESAKNPKNNKKEEHEIDAAILKKLEDGFTSINYCNSNSVLKKYMTREIFDKLKNKQTSYGATLLDCVQSGYINHDSKIGIYASDPDAYTVFNDLFLPIIKSVHSDSILNDCHPATNWGDLNLLTNIYDSNQLVLSTRIRCARSIDGYPFGPIMTQDQFMLIENDILTALRLLDGDHKGKYYSLIQLNEETTKKLIDEHYLFKNNDRYLEAAKCLRFWPKGRGIYYNAKKNFLVWINEEDHMRVISMESGGNIGSVYKRLVSGMQKLQKQLKFAKNKQIGYLTTCPSNVGCTIRASVLIRLPKLSQPKNKKKLDSIIDNFKLDVRGTRGEHSETEDFVFDVSNKQRLGITEFEAVKSMYDGVLELIKAESSLK